MKNWLTTGASSGGGLIMMRKSPARGDRVVARASRIGTAACVSRIAYSADLS